MVLFLRFYDIQIRLDKNSPIIGFPEVERTLGIPGYAVQYLVQSSFRMFLKSVA